jgi:fluoride exporter
MRGLLNGEPALFLTLLLIAIGGAIGSIARFLVSTYVQSHARSGFPWGTYAVNATGCLAIGAVFGVFDAGDVGDAGLVFLVAGVLGGYTTFSTFSVENLKLLENRQYGWLLHNTAGQIVGGLFLVIIGYGFINSLM